MRNTCAELQEKYGISYATIDYLLHDELPEVLPEELPNREAEESNRREIREAMANAGHRRPPRAVAAAMAKLLSLQRRHVDG